MEFQINSWRDKYFESKLQIRIVGNIFDFFAIQIPIQWIVLLLSLRYTRCMPTQPISVQCLGSVAAHCWFNADKLSKTLTQHYSNTGSVVYLVAAPRQIRAIYPILLRCWPNVFDTGLRLKQHWVIVPCWLGMIMRDTRCFSRRQKNHYPDKTIHWSNADAMPGHRLWHWANIISTLSIKALIMNIIMNVFFFLSMQLLDLATSNVIFDMLRTVPMKCQPFPTRHPSSRKLGHI